MRKVVVGTFLSLDGVMQAPGSPEEDTKGGFDYGGWQLPYFDEIAGKVVSDSFAVFLPTTQQGVSEETNHQLKGSSGFTLRVRQIQTNGGAHR